MTSRSTNREHSKENFQMSNFQPFVMERMMGKWENVVRYNLSESGVHPLKLGELMAMAGRTVGELGEVEIN